jgi:2-polyprenyl-3-methyl-5-hydroxy-6-metoxy-1,4-benzoquinol methylase
MRRYDIRGLSARATLFSRADPCASCAAMATGDRAKWDARYAQGSAGEAPAWIDAPDLELPRGGRALDVAAGSGRIALWAARRGLEVTAVDVSPVGLAILSSAAAREGLAIETVQVDLEQAELPAGPFSLITCFHYHQPSLWPALRSRLAPGGVVLAELLTVANLERHPHPSRRWLSRPNELLDLAAAGLHVVFYREGWIEDRSVARLLARR